MGVEYLVHTLGLLGLVQLGPVYSGSIKLQPGSPGVYQLLLSPGPAEGNPTGCL